MLVSSEFACSKTVSVTDFFGIEGRSRLIAFCVWIGKKFLEALKAFKSLKFK